MHNDIIIKVNNLCFVSRVYLMLTTKRAVNKHPSTLKNVFKNIPLLSLCCLKGCKLRCFYLLRFFAFRRKAKGCMDSCSSFSWDFYQNLLILLIKDFLDKFVLVLGIKEFKFAKNSNLQKNCKFAKIQTFKKLKWFFK